MRWQMAVRERGCTPTDLLELVDLRLLQVVLLLAVHLVLQLPVIDDLADRRVALR